MTTQPDAPPPTIRRGRGDKDAIRAWQAFLNAQGVMVNGKPLKVDGVFGRNTDAATRAIQKRLGVRVDGVVGKQTWTAALTQLPAPGAQASPPAPDAVSRETPQAAPSPPSQPMPQMRPMIWKQASAQPDLGPVFAARLAAMRAAGNAAPQTQPPPDVTRSSFDLALDPLAMGTGGVLSSQPMPAPPPQPMPTPAARPMADMPDHPLAPSQAEAALLAMLNGDIGAAKGMDPRALEDARQSLLAKLNALGNEMPAQ